MDDEQLLRYSRQIMLPNWDVACQEKVLAAKVLIVGLGGLGCPAALYLAASGVGELILNDDDKVDLSNLQRQVCHGTDDIDQFKVLSARRSIHALNAEVKVQPITERLDEAALLAVVSDVDLVLDGTDNFNTRSLVNRICVEAKKPLVSGAAIGMEGQVFVYHPNYQGNRGSACYHCLYGELTDENLSCAENGVMSPVVGIIGSIMALEALKVLAGFHQALVEQLLVMDARTMEWRKLRFKRDPQCAVCGI